jgi:hypothetical protein
MAKSKSPKTNGVKEAVPAIETQPMEIQRAATTPQPAAAAASPSVLSEPATKVEARTPKVTKNPAAKLESVRSESRGTVVPINLEDEIRRLAYLLSERRGFTPGHENEDWLTAEHEVLQRYRQHSAQTA